MAIANWYEDPADPTRVRWWDGAAWTEHTGARPENVQPAFAIAGAAATAWYAPESTPARLLSGRPSVPAHAVSTGWVPDTCTRHNRPPSGARRIRFLSTLPLWTYLLLLVGVLVFVVVAAVIRKSVTSPAWPLCETCLATRRRSMAMVWLGLGGVAPLLWLDIVIDGGNGSGLAAILMVAVVVGLPIVAAVGGIVGSWSRIVGGAVTADGDTVFFRPGEIPVAATVPGSAGGVGSSSRGVDILPS